MIALVRLNSMDGNGIHCKQLLVDEKGARDNN